MSVLLIIFFSHQALQWPGCVNITDNELCKIYSGREIKTSTNFITLKSNNRNPVRVINFITLKSNNRN